MTKAFTLVEMMIVLVVIGILVTVLFKVYATLTAMSARVRAQKDIGDALIHTMTIVQNIADTHTLNYTGLASGGSALLTQVPLLTKGGESATLSIASGTIFFITQSGNIKLLPDNVTLDHSYFAVWPLQSPRHAVFNDIYAPGFRRQGELRSRVLSSLSLPIQTYFGFLSR